MASASQIADALAGRYGPVVLRFRYEWRSITYQFLADLSPAVIGPASIALDNTRAVTRSLTLAIDPDLLPAGFVPGESLIAPVCDLRVAGEWVTFEQGLYRSDVARRQHREGGRSTLDMQCSDVSVYLDQPASEPYAVALATNYATAVGDLLDALSLPHDLPATSAVTPVAHTWGPEAIRRAIADGICAGVNRFPLYAGRRGVFTTADRGDDPADATPAVTYTDGVEPLMIEATADYVRQDDFQKPNQAVVVIDDPRHANYGYVRRANADATSRVSTANRAVDQAVYNSDSTPSMKAVLDTATATAIADRQLREAAGAAEAATLTTFMDPRRDAHETYRLQIAGVEDGTLWRVLGWRMRLEVGALMEHQIVRAPAVTVSTP